jgi:hypothetical protein
MARRRVVVEGGGANLYEISDSGGRYYAYKIKVGLVFDDRVSLGSCRTLQDAISLVQAHSGRRIRSID